MLIIGTLIGLVAVGVVIGLCTKAEDLASVITGIAAILLFVALILIPLSRMETQSDIAEFISVQTTADAARAGATSQNYNNIELAALTMKIADMNAWLASAQYRNRTVFDIWIPDDVDSLQPIK